MKKLLSFFSWVISIVFHPIGMAGIGCLFILFSLFPINNWKLAFLLLKSTILTTYLLPILAAAIFEYIIHIQKNKLENKRLYLLLIIIPIYCIYSEYLGIFLPFGPYIFACTISLFVAAIITIFWRISLHMIGIGGLLGMLITYALQSVYFYDFVEIIPLTILVAGAIATSRLYLKAHSPAQIYTGFLLGFITTSSILYFFADLFQV